MPSRSLSIWVILSIVACGRPAGPADSDEPVADLVFEAYFEPSRPYTGIVNTKPEIVIRDAITGEIRRLLPAGTAAREPAPSPDGSRIAFVMGDPGLGLGDIYVANRDGSGLTQLTSDPELDDQPAWSPDGTRIAFRSFRAIRSGDIWVMNSDGSHPVNLTPELQPFLTDDRRPAWSPDSRRIAYARSISATGCTLPENEIAQFWYRETHCNSVIVTMAADGSDKRRLTDVAQLWHRPLVGTSEIIPSWSPDGKNIAFSIAAIGGFDLVFVPVAGGVARGLNMAGGQAMPVWSNDGQRIAFISNHDSTQRNVIYTARVDANGLSHPQAVVDEVIPGGSRSPAFLRRP